MWGLGIFIQKVFLGVLDGFLYLEVEEKLELIRIGVRVLKLQKFYRRFREEFYGFILVEGREMFFLCSYKK